MSETNSAEYGQDAKPYLVGAFIFSIIGAGLLLGTDFAGYTDYYDYYVGLGAEDLPGYAVPLLVGTALGLVFTAWCALAAAGNLTAKTIARLGTAKIAAAIVFGTVIGGTLIFVQEVSYADEWWLEAGFYGGLIGSGLSWLLIQKALRLLAAPASQPVAAPPAPRPPTAPG
jgi:hypothetical protein